MTRTVGAKNITQWEKRSTVPTTSSVDIKHLASSTTATPLVEFESTISHQRSYLSWIDTRHSSLTQLRKAAKKNARGPKDATFRKYRWYAEQQTLFEAVNAFEVFYKRAFIALAQAIRTYIPPDRIKGAVDARVLWAIRGKTSIASLIFEHQLFHDLEQIDKATHMLVESRRYNIGNPTKAMRPTVKALQAAFQVRHTLAHNQGYVTTSDSAKFEFFGYGAQRFEVIDPQKEQMGEAIRRFLVQEAKDFTNWILDATAAYLGKLQKETGVVLRKPSFHRLQSTLGSTANLVALPWTDA